MKQVHLKNQRTISGLVGMSIAFLLSSCGGAAYQSPGPSEPQTRANADNPYFPNNPNNPNNPDHDGRDQPMSSTFSIQGTRGGDTPAPLESRFVLPDVYTDTILRLDLVAAEDVTALDIGCVIKSSCLELTVTVFDHDTQKKLGSTQKVSAHTGALDGMGTCGGEQARPKLDLSSRLPRNHGGIDLVFDQAKSLIYSNSCYSWDGKIPNPILAGLYYNYTQEATVTVHLNGTW